MPMLDSKTLRERAATIPLSERQRLVAALKPETALQVAVKQLLERMGASWVEIRQGADEFGKDVVARFESRFGGAPEFVAVVAKLGKNYGKATGSSNLATVLHQIDQAFTIPMPTVKEPAPVSINRVIVVCTGDVAGNARTEIGARSAKSNRNVDYWECDRLVQLFTDNLPEFFFGTDKD